MQSAEDEFGALHEWINKHSVAASARRKPCGVAFTAWSLSPRRTTALGSAL